MTPTAAMIICCPPLLFSITNRLKQYLFLLWCLFSLLLHSPILNLATAQLTLVVLVEEDHAVGVSDGGEHHLLPRLVLDEGHAQGVGAAPAVLSSNNISNIVTVSSVNLNIEAVGLQSFQSHSAISSLKKQTSLGASENESNESDESDESDEKLLMELDNF